ncbi:hypothetical protein ACFYWS_38970 [Streptomyces sp. NPDC002795]|uniref:pPIWI_RE_Z domain-containing protein n=1 Tax=Streptomyces sp. NPDC002795 TaxID=3364665 RepID=UPI0036A36302
MRDRSSWYQQLVDDLKPWPAEYVGTKPALLCQVELGLRLLETLDPGRAADGVWVLLGGYPFAEAAGIADGPADRLALAAARHLLWPMRRGRMWRQSLEAYLELPERLRAYRVPGNGGPARRVRPPVAAHRLAVYDKALGRLPDFSENPLPPATEGAYRFMDRRRHASVDVPADLVLDQAAGHDLGASRPGRGEPLSIPLAELEATARWMDTEELGRGLKAGHWADRLSRLHLDARTADGTAFVEAHRLTLDQLTHLVGMVGAGKSTLMMLVAVWAHRAGLRTTLVVGDVAEQLTLTDLLCDLGLRAALVQGGTTREQHTQRLHRRLAARGQHSLLAHTSRTFAHLSTACPLDALRGLEASEPLRYADAPCGGLHPVRQLEVPEESSEASATRELLRARGAGKTPQAEETSEAAELRNPHSCPLWSACPRHSTSRDLVDALIWVANPASLVQTAVPRQLNAERLRYLELACLRSDIMIVDEADRVQMQLDQMFAPSATLVTTGPESWLDQLQTHEIAELAGQGRLQLSDQDVERWSAALDVVGSAADRLYAMLIGDKQLRDWAQIDYFSAWTLQEKLLQAWYPLSAAPSDEEMQADHENDGEPELHDESELYEDEEGLGAGASEAGAVAGQPWAGRRDEVTKLFDVFRDDPLGDRGPYGTDTDALVRLAHDVLHTLNAKRTRKRVRDLLDALLDEAPGPEQRRLSAHPRKVEPAPGDVALSEEWLELNARRLEFTLVLAALHQRLDRLTFLWPQVEAALRLDPGGHELTRRPPLDYAPLLPEAPMGNVLGFQYLPDERGSARDRDGRCTGTLRFFRCAGVGRELLLSLPRLGAGPEHPAAGPHVLLMSGTSWAGTSTRAHVLAPVQAVLKPQPEALHAIRRTVFRTEFVYDDAGNPIRLSGQHPDKREDVLRTLVHKLARPGRDGSAGPLQYELAQIPDQRRRRALLLVGSYREAAVTADLLNEIPRWHGRVRVLAADDAELESAIAGEPSVGGPTTSRAGSVRRGDVASFAADVDAELLVAPLLAVERGHNILTDPQQPGEERVAAFGTVFFLVRPHPRPDDLSLAIFAINDWATRFVRDHPGLPQGTFSELVGKAADLDDAGNAFRKTARGVWRHLLSRPYIYSALSEAEKQSFAWDQLVTIWQVIGRLVRGGVPARVVFVDAAFAPRLAAKGSPAPPLRGPRWLKDPGLLVRLQDVLEPYFAGDDVSGALPDQGDPALVRLLYQPLYEALRSLDSH